MAPGLSRLAGLGEFSQRGRPRARVVSEDPRSAPHVLAQKGLQQSGAADTATQGATMDPGWLTCLPPSGPLLSVGALAPGSHLAPQAPPCAPPLGGEGWWKLGGFRAQKPYSLPWGHRLSEEGRGRHSALRTELDLGFCKPWPDSSNMSQSPKDSEAGTLGLMGWKE